jgi:hypothetical protein
MDDINTASSNEVAKQKLIEARQVLDRIHRQASAAE